MKLTVALAVCALALLDVAKTAPADQSAPQGALRSMSMEMPSLKERLAGARPRRNRGQPRAAPPRRGQAIARSPLRHEGPSVPQPDIAGTTTFHRDDANALIINGDTAVTGQFPWMAAVNIDNMYFCGGSVIAEDWVLTAAHCLDGSTSFTVTAGSLLYKGGEESTRQDSTTTRSIMHPDYSDIFVDNDIGLLQMPKPFVFNDNLRPIRLPSYSQGVDMMVGKKATISGWGVTNDDYYAEKPLSLLYVDLTINDGSACYDYYGNVWIPNKVCFDTSQNQKSSCSGDSGGPLVILEDDGKYTEIGLTSFGASRGCTLGLPIAFTRVASFLEFIETTTGLKARDY